MKYKINEDYNLTTDKYNYIVNKRYKKQDGGSAFKIDSYHSTINSALKSIADNSVLQSDVSDLQKLCDKLDSLKRDIDDMEFGGVSL